MTDYTKGQRVTFTAVHTARVTGAGNGHMNVELESTRVADVPVAHWTHSGNDTSVFMALDGDLVELVSPVGWPPQIGDIWEVEGKEWIVRATGTTRMFLAVIDQTDWCDPIGPDFLYEFKKLNPTLVRRRGQ